MSLRFVDMLVQDDAIVAEQGSATPLVRFDVAAGQMLALCTLWVRLGANPPVRCPFVNGATLLFNVVVDKIRK
jgi:hypothetical protein